MIVERIGGGEVAFHLHVLASQILPEGVPLSLVAIGRTAKTEKDKAEQHAKMFHRPHSVHACGWDVHGRPSAFNVHSTEAK